jgi:hypothetical protein
LSALYADQGRLAEAEAMYERALRGKEKAIEPETFLTHIPTLYTMSGFASLRGLIGTRS